MLALFVSSILLLAVFGRRNMFRECFFAFHAAQAVIWPLSIFSVYLGLINSPVHLFPKATDSVFIVDFILYPSVFAVYYANYPHQKNHLLQPAFTLAVSTSITLVHVALQKYTNLVNYISVSGYTYWVLTIVSFSLLRLYIDWYFMKFYKEASNHRK